MPRERRQRRSKDTIARPAEEQFVVGNCAMTLQSSTKTAKMFPNTTYRQVRYYKEKVEMDVHWVSMVVDVLSRKKSQMQCWPILSYYCPGSATTIRDFHLVIMWI